MSLSNAIIKFSDLLEPEHSQVLTNYVSNLNFSSNPSFVFNREKEVNELVPEVRKSQTCFSHDRTLLKFLNDVLIPTMNQKHALDASDDTAKCTFSLARDYVTFIKYEEGGFFDWHVDHEKVRINHGENGFKEMHFIYCVQGCLEGGQLLIKKKDGDKLTEMGVEEARISNAAVVFDKSMEHKGDEVLQGTKIIMTVDVYVVSELRLKAGLSSELEEEMSQLLAKKRDWISFGGNARAFQLAWETVTRSSKIQRKLVDETNGEFVPFLEIKLLKSETEKYHVFSCHLGVLFVCIEREDPSTGEPQKFEFDGKGLSVWPNFKKGARSEDNEDGDQKVFYYPDITDPDMQPLADEGSSVNEDLFETIVKISETLNQSSGNPSDLLCALLYDVGLMGGEDQVEEWPEIPPINKLIQPDLLPKLVDAEVQYYVNHEAFEKWAWAETKAGYSYYCNEPNYDSFDVHYRYGFVRNCYKCT